MPTTKTDTLTACIDPTLKQAVRIAAAVERCSLSNMLEVMSCAYGRQQSLTLPDAPPHVKTLSNNALTV